MGTTATGRPRNRSWPEALKREIVASSFAPGSSFGLAKHVAARKVAKVLNDNRSLRGRPAACDSAPLEPPWTPRQRRHHSGHSGGQAHSPTARVDSQRMVQPTD